MTLTRDDQPIRSMLTDTDGRFVMAGVPPNYENGQQYGLRFSAPGAGSRTALLGEADSDFTDGLQRIDDIVVQGGSNLRDLNLPIDPNGVVYDSVGRTPIPGAVLTLVDGRTNVAMPSSCFDDPRQQGQVTLPNGYYKFDLNFADPACAAGALYTIQVTPPSSNYVSGVSELIPPTSSLSTRTVRRAGVPADRPTTRYPARRSTAKPRCPSSHRRRRFRRGARAPCTTRCCG